MAKMPSFIRKVLERRARPLGPVPRVDRIFREARNYHGAALRCFEMRPGDAPLPFLPTQGVVLQAFASELYFKALYVLENDAAAPRGHDLEALFKKLAKTTQETISLRYSGRYAHGDLVADLKHLARVFQQWRYCYEFVGGHEVDHTAMAHLGSALYETCTELRPTLIQPGPAHDRLTAAAQGVPIFA
jgi:hypothetical protein